MSLIKLNDRAVKDVTEFGSISSLGSLTHISTATASASASIEFTSGIDSTYKEYVFYFVNIHAETDGAIFQFQADTGTNTSYNQTITSTSFRVLHNEGGTTALLQYRTDSDLAQGTGFQSITGNAGVSVDNDMCTVGKLNIFNPSSSTFVKHFISRTNTTTNDLFSFGSFTAGYFNTITALTRFQFKFNTGNIDSGQILLFGVN
jgi:hypothetical protein